MNWPSYLEFSSVTETGPGEGVAECEWWCECGGWWSRGEMGEFEIGPLPPWLLGDGETDILLFVNWEVSLATREVTTPHKQTQAIISRNTNILKKRHQDFLLKVNYLQLGNRSQKAYNLIMLAFFCHWLQYHTWHTGLIKLTSRKAEHIWFIILNL